MLSALLSSLRWAFAAAVVAGVSFAGWSFMQAQTLERIRRDGVDATAAVDGGEREPGRRSATAYRIHATWETGAADAGGMERSETIAISSDYARKVTDGDFLLIESAQITYLPKEPSVEAVVAEDLPQRITDQREMIYAGMGVGVMGLVGSAAIFFLGRRKKTGRGETSSG